MHFALDPQCQPSLFVKHEFRSVYSHRSLSASVDTCNSSISIVAKAQKHPGTCWKWNVHRNALCY